jgi:ribonuclease HII
MKQSSFNFDNLQLENLCGIDEAGRGPFAGPMTIAGVRFKNDISKIKEFEILNDSKKLTEKKREMLFDIIKEHSYFHIVSVSNKQIDELGISACIKNAIIEIMQTIDAINYLMDGNTSFGIEDLQHKIKADGDIKEVSAASILAKVTRDRYMVEIAKKYPNYDFHKHKGYGTKAHIEAIKKYGFCDLHRRSYKIKGLE